ncbi:MAG: hypothetical protein M0Z36_05335 [Thermaerobacter sp.]|nr:hypothetical protein [Thermaerobacter sp.]
MSMDDIAVIIGRLLIAVVVIGGVYAGVHIFAPGWFDNTMNSALNGVVNTIGIG